MSDAIIPFSELIKGDSRNRRLTTDTLQEYLGEMRLSPNAPEVVAFQVLLTKRTFLAGWFFYELFTDAVHHAAVSCEAALRERFVASLPLPIILDARRIAPDGTRPSRTLDDRPEAATLDEMLRRAWRLRSDPEMRLDYSNLIAWAEDASVLAADATARLNGLRQWRNSSAHGTIAVMTPGPILGVLQEAIWIINDLFPDAATSAWDAPRRTATREAQEREHQRRRQAFEDERARRDEDTAE